MTMTARRVVLALAASLAMAACAAPEPEVEVTRRLPLFPGETQDLRVLVNRYADEYEVPRTLVHRVIQRESDYRPQARNGPYYGLMQILPATARGMGFQGQAGDLLDAETNLKWAVKYLRGAWLLSDGDETTAVKWYARGYYYEARDRCMLVETNLLHREINRNCD
ncbi:lytic transglycosylase domain-containing protein [Pseudooceanicola aestuarii]|uniref:lytic transglycosylase domain-containing protein n=1 Tax=Pseudooceanicola aestuarii TaxID=2697319 RepID=UPI0013D5B0D1|nr:lytic transglycosylase domain-containing protein [Pseudooceanicola aestuarii]